MLRVLALGGRFGELARTAAVVGARFEELARTAAAPKRPSWARPRPLRLLRPRQSWAPLCLLRPRQCWLRPLRLLRPRQPWGTRELSRRSAAEAPRQRPRPRATHRRSVRVLYSLSGMETPLHTRDP